MRLADTRARRAANPACTYTSAELPTNTYAHPQNPTAPPCPTTCTDFGWEIYPEGFRRVLGIAGGYGKPIYVTENGLADGDDDLRATYVPLIPT
jgi:beta-glucosidase/6-phospho-beta-glucosidase/beta-galactosidase